MTSSVSRDTVLLLTHSADFYTIELVAEALARRGARTFRFDTDRFPSTVKLSARAGDGSAVHLITDAGAQVSSAEISAVWLRKLWTPQLDADLDERYREMCVRESVAALEGFLDALYDARWVNEIERERAAGNKLRQLRLAAQAGLRIPRSLVTNDPAAVRQFYDETEGQMVAKLLRPLTVSMNADSLFVYTSRVGEEDLDNAETLRHSPMVFQELIPKAFELRIAWVAGEAFTGALYASGTARGQTDWRRAAPQECRWQKGELPVEVFRGLQLLMTELNLVFGAIDLICTPAGEYVFLEVNPGGEWGMLERDLGLPIADRIARALLLPS
ncbi:MAG TPA: MvdC family ATP-grasp ribosomal peptide maturase [Pyrinomonadaceae bacterium]|jgi:MvdC family ATP-grasp ribosomal peptide maturase|nr:MvdC family ATP-grasp ribosomal peptide maturase [Pyrinomonadaceae bacterium]